MGNITATNDSTRPCYGSLGASSDGGASVFSQRSAASKSSSATGKSGASTGSATIALGKSGLPGIPRAAIEGSAFVIPAQEVRPGYSTRSCAGYTAL